MAGFDGKNWSEKKATRNMSNRPKGQSGATLKDHSDFSKQMHTTMEAHAALTERRDAMGLSDNAHAAKDKQGGAPMISKFGGDSCFGGGGCS